MSLDAFYQDVKQIVQHRQLLTGERQTRWYRTGIRVGGGSACAVILPNSLVELWRVLEVCVKHDKIIIVQAANTGLTAGSTPSGDDYDRDVVIVNTLRINKLFMLDGGRQVLALAGTTLFKLEDALAPIHRTPHSIIGSSCIGASVVGGICNNSGGNLVNRGPAYTELSLYAQLTEEGELRLINNLGIDLGTGAMEILSNLDNGNFDAEHLKACDRQASDHEYQQRVREINAPTPARFNADKRRLYESSGCAGKLAVFAVRLDTFPEPLRQKVFYVGSNDPAEFSALRKHILTQFVELPEMVEYMHRSYFDAADQYCKDTFVFIRLLGSAFLPKLFSFKTRLDGLLSKFPFLPPNMADRTLQLCARLWPDHLPKRMRDYRDHYQHHLMVAANDDAIEETRNMLAEFYGQAKQGEWFECTKREGEAAQLHRFVAGGAAARYIIMHTDEAEGLMPLDIALPRNEEQWHDILPAFIVEKLAAPLQLSHFLCMVFHWDFVVKKGVDIDALKAEILTILDQRGAKYPAEHNVGHLYQAAPELDRFYRTLDPTNSFNAGIGCMSKFKHYR